MFRKFFDEGLASGGALVVTAPNSGEIIGYSRYDRTRAAPDEVEIGWTFLARDFWGGAANREIDDSPRIRSPRLCAALGGGIEIGARQFGLQTQRRVPDAGSIIACPDRSTTFRIIKT